MKRSSRSFSVMVLAQAACLALGLWLEVRFARSTVENTPAQGPGVRQSETNLVTVDSEQPGGVGDSGGVAEPPTTAIRLMAFVWIAALQAVVAYLILSRVQAETTRTQLSSATESLRRHNDLLRTRDAVIFGLARLTESRDPETGNHLDRIALYSTRLAAALRRNPRYRQQISPAFVKLIGISSALHDIGKVGIQDSILLKPGKLEEQERVVMQLHPGIGGKCVREIELRLGSSNFLQMAREIAFYHHECWDGTGYSQGLAGESIPLAARIVALADVYDALSTKRVYKEAYPHEKCVEIIKKAAGTQFDPAIVEAFLGIQSAFRGIARRCADAEHERAGEQEHATHDPRDDAVCSGPNEQGTASFPILDNEAPVDMPCPVG